jgi:hypothetical protein
MSFYINLIHAESDTWFSYLKENIFLQVMFQYCVRVVIVSSVHLFLGIGGMDRTVDGM